MSRTLVYRASLAKVQLNDRIRIGKEVLTIVDMIEPRTETASGRVYVRNEHGRRRGCDAASIGAAWITSAFQPGGLS